MSRARWLDELEVAVQDVRGPSDAERDFGGGAAVPPAAVVRTQTDEELRRVLELASRHRISVAVRGAGHSSGGQTFVPAGIVLSHTPPDARLTLLGDSVEVPGHWEWQRVEQSLRALDRDLPVATSHLGTTVGGTLSVGGFGVRSISRGAQVDHVTALELIGADGRARWCSPEAEPEVFGSALTGAGQVGIISRARMKTMSQRRFLSCEFVQHASLAELAASASWLADSSARAPDYFSALLKGGVVESTVATAHSSESEAKAARGQPWLQTRGRARFACVTTAQFEAEERAMPDHWSRGRNLWCDYCFDAEGFLGFCDFVDRELSGRLSTHLAYAMCIAPGPPNALDMRPHTDRRLFSLGLFFSVAVDDVSGAADSLDAHRKALEHCTKLGGRPYLYGCWGGRAGLPAAVLRDFFGEGYERLRQVRSRLDPLGTLNPNAISYL